MLGSLLWLFYCGVGIIVASSFGFVFVRQLADRIGPSITLGTGILVGLSIFGVLNTSVPVLRHYPWITVWLLGAGVLVMTLLYRRFRFDSEQLHEVSESCNEETRVWDIQVLLVVLGIAFFGVSYFAVWTRLFGLVIVGLGLSLKWLSGLAAVPKMLCLSALGATMVIADQIRRSEPGWWFAASNDAVCHEAWGWSLATQGPHSHPGITEGSIVGYHYLAYAVSGSLTYLASAPPFVVLNVVLPFLLLASSCLVMLPVLRRRTGSLTAAAGILMLYMISLQISSMPSYLFGQLAVINYLILILGQRNLVMSYRKKLAFEILLGVVGVVAVFGKVTTLPMLGAIALFAICVSVSDKRIRSLSDFVLDLPVNVIFPCVFVVIYYLGNLNIGRQDSGGATFLRILLGNQSREQLWTYRDHLGFLIVNLSIGGIALLSLLQKYSRARSDLTLVLCLAGVGTVSLLLNSSWVQRNYIGSGFQSMLILSLLLNASRLIGARHVSRSLGRVAVDSATLLGVAALTVVHQTIIWPVFLKPEYELTKSWIIWLLARGPWLAVVAIAAGCVGWPATRFKLKSDLDIRDFSQTAFAALALVATSPISFTNIVEQRWLANRDTSQTFSLEATHPDGATSDVGRYIQENTSKSAIIASNAFLTGEDSGWLDKEISLLLKFDNVFAHPEFGSGAWGGCDYLLASVSRRQFLLTGPRCLVDRENAQTVARRLKASLLFGRFGSERDAAELREDGADYFVVDKVALGDLAVPPFKERTVFENSRYLVLDLAT